MKKITLISAGIFLMLNICQAQLNKLCPVSSTVYDSDKIKEMNLLLNTKDFSSILSGGKTHRTSTFQLVNVTNPFPPIWFQMGNPAADTGNFVETTFLGDMRIQKHSGNLTLNSSYPALLGITSMDTATLLMVDSLSKYESPYKDQIRLLLDLHDYDVDSKGNKLITNQLQRKADVRCLSNIEKDSNRTVLVNDIIILDKNDSIIFYWDALQHFTVCAMKWEYRNSSLMYGDVINWSHVNSARFANDGNIIYSFRHIGVGKINRQTGEIMWQLGGKDPKNSIYLPDTAGYYLQHDFLQRPDGLYSLFSNGDEAHPYLEGLVYDIDEVKKTATLVSRYKPQPAIFSKALGNYDCKGDTCVICLGMYNINTNPKENQEMAHILFGKKLAASISAPALNYAYQVKQTKWTAWQFRPKVKLQKNKLQTDSLPGLHDYTWYKIDSTTATPAGTGRTFSPAVSGNYVVEAQKGTGIFRSYLVSDIFVYKKKKSK